MDIFDNGSARQETSGKDAEQGRGSHRAWRRKTSTSLTLRELVGVLSQRCSRDEMAIQPSSPG